MFIRVEHDLVMEDAPHEHDFDMYVWVVPLEQGNMEDLGCEVYMYYGSGEAGDETEEKVLTKTGCFFVPKGVRHGPMGFRKVTRNVLFIHAMTAEDYYKTKTYAIPESRP
jgi:hypothetical protein